MGLLRASVKNTPDWWEARLLDLDIFADGENEDKMLHELEHALVAHYYIALEHGRTPFVDLLVSCPRDVSQSWESGDKKLRSLNLPDEVRQALSAVFRSPTIADFKLEPIAA